MFAASAILDWTIFYFMAYVYRHIRLDKNEVFYIGIGKDSDSNYRRAYVKEGRNSHWINITNITDYEIEIIIDNLTWEEAAVKEIEFISLYGRYDIGHGTLVNQTDGGTGGSDGGKAKGKVWVYKEGVQTRIKRELLEDHLKEGWTKGLLESTIKKRGTVHKNLLWINKDGCNLSLIHISEPTRPY